MEYVYTEAAKILAKYDRVAKNSKAGCVSCGECSALPISKSARRKRVG
jgi:hypothetical protein